MYHTYFYKDKHHVVWSYPFWLPNQYFATVKEKKVKLYDGSPVKRGDKVLQLAAPDDGMAVGDSIWLISFLRDWYRTRGQRNCQMHVGIPPSSEALFKTFLPKNFKIVPYVVDETFFDKMDYILPALVFTRTSGGGV